MQAKILALIDGLPCGDCFQIPRFECQLSKFFRVLCGYLSVFSAVSAPARRGGSLGRILVFLELFQKQRLAHLIPSNKRLRRPKLPEYIEYLAILKDARMH